MSVLVGAGEERNFGGAEIAEKPLEINISQQNVQKTVKLVYNGGSKLLRSKKFEEKSN